MSDEPMSQRDRRRQQHNATKPKVQLNKSDLKQWIGPIAILVLVGGVVGAMMLNGASGDDAEACSGHYHYTMDIFLDGQKVILNPPGDTTFTSGSHHLHMHESSGPDTQRNLIHNHKDGGRNPPIPDNCFSYDDAFDMVSASLAPDALTLRAAHGSNEGVYEATDGKSIRVYGKGWDDAEWRELDVATIGTKIAPESSQFAVVYGNADADALAMVQEFATPFPVSSYAPNNGHYTSFDDLRDKP